MNRKGKVRHNRKTNTVGKRTATKRAVVTLHAGDRIDLFERAEKSLMPLRKRKPTSPGRRFQSSSDFSEITRTRPEKSLLGPKPRTGGRNSYGRKTARHRGGGHKQQYRIIDFKRDKDGVPAKVATIEYDPNRHARIALLHYFDGEKRYILAPGDVRVGDVLGSGQGAEIRSGNAPSPCATYRWGRPFTARRTPARSRRQARPGSGEYRCAARGQGGPVRHPAPSVHQEMRRVPIDCRGTLGEVGNAEAELISIGKAGRNRCGRASARRPERSP